MSWLLVACGALLAVPVLLLAVLAYGRPPAWLELWHVLAVLPLCVALFLAAAIVDLLTFDRDDL
jgi:hypothetical protein